MVVATTPEKNSKTKSPFKSKKASGSENGSSRRKDSNSSILSRKNPGGPRMTPGPKSAIKGQLFKRNFDNPTSEIQPSNTSPTEALNQRQTNTPSNGEHKNSTSVIGAAEVNATGVRSRSPGTPDTTPEGSPETITGMETATSGLSRASSHEERSQHIWVSNENSNQDTSPVSSVFSSRKSSPNTILNSPRRHKASIEKKRLHGASSDYEDPFEDISPVSQYSLGLRHNESPRKSMLHADSIDGGAILHGGEDDDWILSVQMDGRDPQLKMESPKSARESLMSPQKSDSTESSPKRYSSGSSVYQTANSSPMRRPSTPLPDLDARVSPEAPVTPNPQDAEREEPANSMDDPTLYSGYDTLTVMRQWQQANGLDKASPADTPVGQRAHFFIDTSPSKQRSPWKESTAASPKTSPTSDRNYFGSSKENESDEHSPEKNGEELQGKRRYRSTRADWRSEDRAESPLGSPGRRHSSTSPPRFTRDNSGRQVYRNKDGTIEAEKASQERLQHRARSSRRSTEIFIDKETRAASPVEQMRAPIFEAHHYILTLRRYLDPDKKIKTLSKQTAKSDDPNRLSTMLKKLKLDLKMSFDSFQEDFMNAPNSGLTLLVQLLRDLHADQQQRPTPGGRRIKHEQQKRTLTDEYDTLVCIKFIAEREFGLQNIINLPSCLDAVAQCLISSHTKTRIVALEVLTLCCSSQTGYQRVLDAMTLHRINNAESVRFKVLVGMLQSHGSSYVHFQCSCVRFFNTLLRNESNMNAKLYLQHELLLAGFEVDQLEQLAYGIGDEYDELQRELIIWRENYIDVQNLQSDVNDLEGRNFLLRQEVDLLQGKLKTVEKEKRALDRQMTELNERCEGYQDKIASLQDTVHSLTDLYKENTGKEAGNEVQALDTVLQPYDEEDNTSDPCPDKYATVRSIGSVASMGGVDPPPPPPIFDSLPSSPGRKVVVPKVVLPLFNWTPITEIKNTVFLNSEPEEFYERIDLSDFEKKFELKVKMESRESRERRERALRRLQNQVRFIETSRARNMIITKRRIGLAAEEIEDAVNNCDVEKIPGEYAELLLKYMPTKDEIRLLAQHANDYTELAEAERFLFHMAQIDRLESKLSVMSFMGIFEDLTRSLVPQLEHICRASLSITGNHKMKKIFEIILALGNYMNGGRRGYSYGFKLDSLYKLTEIKSGDKSTSMLHYLVEMVERHYPELRSWHHDLDIDIGRAASLQALLADVHTLRRGVVLVRSEKDKLENDAILQAFHKRVAVDVPRIAELHKRMEDAYKDACSKYGENFKSIEPDAFFRIFHDFVNHYKAAEAELARRRYADSIPMYTSAELDSSPRAPHLGRKSSSFLHKKGVDDLHNHMRALNNNLNENKENDDPFQRKRSVFCQDPGQAHSNTIAKMVENHFLRKSTENLSSDQDDFVSKQTVQLESREQQQPKIRQIKQDCFSKDKKSPNRRDSTSSKFASRSRAGRITPPPDYSIQNTPQKAQNDSTDNVTDSDIDDYYAAANGDTEADLGQDVVTFL